MNDEEPEGGGSYSAALGEYASNPDKPRMVGVPLVIPDKCYTLATDEARIKAQFEQQVKVWAQEPIVDALRANNQDEADALRQAYLTKYGARAYTWDGEACRAARKDWQGVTYLLFLMLRRSHPKITLEEADELVSDFPKECGAAMRLAEGNFQSSHAARLRREKRARTKTASSNGARVSEIEPAGATETPEPMTMES